MNGNPRGWVKYAAGLDAPGEPSHPCRDGAGHERCKRLKIVLEPPQSVRHERPDRFLEQHRGDTAAVRRSRRHVTQSCWSRRVSRPLLPIARQDFAFDSGEGPVHEKPASANQPRTAGATSCVLLDNRAEHRPNTGRTQRCAHEGVQLMRRLRGQGRLAGWRVRRGNDSARTETRSRSGIGMRWIDGFPFGRVCSSSPRRRLIATRPSS